LRSAALCVCRATLLTSYCGEGFDIMCFGLCSHCVADRGRVQIREDCESCLRSAGSLTGHSCLPGTTAEALPRHACSTRCVV
jgi:hypothetical protein